MRKINKILLYSDFMHEWEIILTDIPIEKIKYYIFMYANWYDLKLDFWEILKNSGYRFCKIASSEENFRSEIDEYPIKESYFINDFFYDI